MKQLFTFFPGLFFAAMLAGSLICGLGILSCQRENQTLPQKEISATQRAAIERAGYNSQGAFFDKFGNIVVEGDIALSPELLLSANLPGTLSDRQRAAGEFCARSYIPSGLSATYFISDAFDDTWKLAIKEGVEAWKTTTNNCNLTEVNSEDGAAIVINREDALGENVYGVADYPCMHHGRNIYLNVSETEADHGSTPLVACIKNVTTHEIGHSFGFHHTDSQADLLSGTPNSDPNSIMLSGESWPIPGGLEWFGNLPGPDTYDFLMAEYFFPLEGAHVEIAQLQVFHNGVGQSSIRFKFQQVTARCYHIHYKLTSGESVILEDETLSDGSNEGWVTINGLSPGFYTLNLCGKNYAQDYNGQCELSATRNFQILVPTCCPTDK